MTPRPIPVPEPGNRFAGFLRHVLTIVGGQLACIAPGCGRGQVGLSRYCRRHTDLILDRDEKLKWMAGP